MRDPRYLACSLETRSEIVVPIMQGGSVLGEIDIDSHQQAAFGETDRDLLEQVASHLAVRLAARAAGTPDDTPDHAHSRRRHRPRSQRSRAPHHQGGRRRGRLGVARRRVLALERHGTPLPVELLDSVRRHTVALKGPVTTPIGEGFTSVNVGLRKALNLFANLRPVWTIAGIPRGTRYRSVIVRENTEGLYSGLEHEVVPGVVESLKVISEIASRRIADFAFDFARKNGRKR